MYKAANVEHFNPLVVDVSIKIQCFFTYFQSEMKRKNLFILCKQFSTVINDNAVYDKSFNRNMLNCNILCDFMKYIYMQLQCKQLAICILMWPEWEAPSPSLSFPSTLSPKKTVYLSLVTWQSSSPGKLTVMLSTIRRLRTWGSSSFRGRRLSSTVVSVCVYLV